MRLRLSSHPLLENAGWPSAYAIVRPQRCSLVHFLGPTQFLSDLRSGGSAINFLEGDADRTRAFFPEHCLRGARIFRRKGLCPLVAKHLAILVGCRLTAILAQRKALVETSISAL